MQDLYVIVCEEEVKGEHDLKIASGIRAYKRILEIKEKYPFRNVNDEPQRIPADLPKPEDCRVFVCGTSLLNWISIQAKALEKAGYSPRIDVAASTY